MNDPVNLLMDIKLTMVKLQILMQSALTKLVALGIKRYVEDHFEILLSI